MEEVVTVTSKGQITLPAKLRRKLEIEKGGKLAVRLEGETIKIRPIPKLSKLAGADRNLFKRRKPSEELREVRGEWDEESKRRLHTT